MPLLAGKRKLGIFGGDSFRTWRDFSVIPSYAKSPHFNEAFVRSALCLKQNWWRCPQMSEGDCCIVGTIRKGAMFSENI